MNKFITSSAKREELLRERNTKYTHARVFLGKSTLDLG